MHTSLVSLPAAASFFLSLAGLAFAAEPEPGVTRVHLGGSGTLALEDLSSPKTPPCRAPCDRELPLDHYYRVAGDDVASRGFWILARPGETASITFNPGHATGAKLTLASKITFPIGMAAVAGGFFLALSGVDHPGSVGDGPTPAILLISGACVALTGGALGIAGFILERQPEIEQHLAVWHDPPAEARGLPKPTTLPVFATAF